MSARFNTLAQWLAWQEVNHPNEIDLGLERVKLVAERLGVLTPNARVITVAGTNGKGSCVAALEALMAANGKKYGAYTSPHFLHYNERIRLAGTPVTDEQLCEAFARIDEARGDISLTYFEFGTLAAMDIFNREPLDYWLMEIGLGGRLDAVNIVAPDVAVLTSIAIDHEAWLGNTREQIGYQKVGICRPKIPFICTDVNPPKSVLDYATELECASVWLGRDFSLAYPVSDEAHSGSQCLLTLSNGAALDISALRLPKPSIAAALEVCLAEGILPEDAVAVLAKVKLTGRMQSLLLPQGQLLLDVAHNPASANLLASEIKREQGVFRQNSSHQSALQQGQDQKEHPATSIRLDAVVAVMADKAISEILEPLVGLVDHWYCADLPGNARAASAQDISSALIALGVCKTSISHSESVNHAVNAWQAVNVHHQLLVFGSFFTVAAVLERKS